MNTKEFCETTGSVARKAGMDANTVRQYANNGWVECLVLASGMRLFKKSAVEEVRKIKEKQLYLRGRYERKPSKPV